MKRVIKKFFINSLASVSLLGLVAPVDAENIPVPIQDIQRFTAAISQIKNYYVEPVKDDKLFDEAIRGMLVGLDPHSSFLDEQDLKELHDTTSGQFSGLGLEIFPETGALKVISPIDDTPAQKAGIKAGDLIVRINNEPVSRMTLREAIVKMRGKPGSYVNITILRKNLTKPLKIKVIRQLIQVQSVKSKLLAKNYGYLRITSFQTNTESELIKAIKKLAQQSGKELKGVILDLRNNPGGLLDSAIDVTNLFLDSRKLTYNRLIVYTKGRYPASQFQAKATSEDMLRGAPMVILINGGSASGAEIVAGALQDYKRAAIIGTKSFGKGSVQTVLPLDGKSALKLTTALYYTPAGRSIQAKGIEPDVVIKELQMPTNKTSKTASFYIKEADLRNHLNSNDKSVTADADEDDEDSNTKNNADDKVQKETLSSLPSIETDYQLHEAFNLLLGMAVTRHFS